MSIDTSKQKSRMLTKQMSQMSTCSSDDAVLSRYGAHEMMAYSSDDGVLFR